MQVKPNACVQVEPSNPSITYQSKLRASEHYLLQIVAAKPKSEADDLLLGIWAARAVGGKLKYGFVESHQAGSRIAVFNAFPDRRMPVLHEVPHTTGCMHAKFQH